MKGITVSSQVAAKMTLAEYRDYDDGTDRRYELVNGELFVMPPESRMNARIAMFLVRELLKLVPFHLICCKDTELEVSGGYATVRLPDLMVLSEELDAILGEGRGTITLEMPPPDLVVEVVSPGKKNQDRDYRYKRSEYAARWVPEYWLVDANAEKVTVLQWVDGLYEEQIFVGEECVVSPQWGELSFTVKALLAAGRGEESYPHE